MFTRRGLAKVLVLALFGKEVTFFLKVVKEGLEKGNEWGTDVLEEGQGGVDGDR